MSLARATSCGRDVWVRFQRCSNSSVHKLGLGSCFLDVSLMVAATADMQWAFNVLFSPNSDAVKKGQSGVEARRITVDIISVARVSRDVLTSTWCFRRCVAYLLVS